MKISFDFENITNMKDFYDSFEEKLPVPDFFGRNLDALHDVISGDLALPLEIEFIHMGMFQMEKFEALIQTMEDLTDEIEDFAFSFSMKSPF